MPRKKSYKKKKFKQKDFFKFRDPKTGRYVKPVNIGRKKIKIESWKTTRAGKNKLVDTSRAQRLTTARKIFYTQKQDTYPVLKMKRVKKSLDYSESLRNNLHRLFPSGSKLDKLARGGAIISGAFQIGGEKLPFSFGAAGTDWREVLGAEMVNRLSQYGYRFTDLRKVKAGESGREITRAFGKKLKDLKRVDKNDFQILLENYVGHEELPRKRGHKKSKKKAVKKKSKKKAVKKKSKKKAVKKKAQKRKTKRR